MIDQDLGPVYNFVTQNLTKDEKKSFLLFDQDSSNIDENSRFAEIHLKIQHAKRIRKNLYKLCNISIFSKINLKLFKTI